MPVTAVELATAYISIVPSIKGIEGHLTSALSGTEGEAKHAGERAGEGFGGGFSERMKHVAEIAGLYEIGAKLKEFATDAIKYYEDVQKINVQTATVITSTGGAAGVSAEHVSKLSETIEAKTATEARSIQSGANMLLTFTNLKNEAGAGNDVYDQSVMVMTNLSRVMGQDSKQSAIQLGKALNDPVAGMTALKRVGIQFSADQKEQIKGFMASNNIMGAQKVILAEMNKEFGGSGASYATTMAGQQDLFKQSTDKLGGSLVGILAPALTGATTGLTDMVTKATDWVQKSGAIQTGFTALKGYAQPFIDSLKNVWGGFKDIAEKAWPYIQEFATSVGRGFKSVYDFLVPVVKGVGDFVTNIGKGSTVSTFGGILTTLGHAFEALMKWVAPLGKVVGDLAGFLGKLPGPIWLGAAALGAFLLLRGPMTAMLTGVDGMTQSMFRLFSGGMISGIKSMGTSLLSALGGPVGVAIIAVTVALGFLIPKLTEATTAEQGVKNATDNHTAAVNDLATALANSNGIIDENIRKTALAALQSEVWGKDGKNTDLTKYADRLAKVGISYKDLVDGMLGVPGAAKKIDDAYNGQVYQLDRVIAAGQRAGGANRAERKAAADQAVIDKRILTEQHDAYAKMPGVINDATDKYKKNTEATKESGTATEATAVKVKKAVDDYNTFASNIPGIEMTLDKNSVATFTTTTERAFAQFTTDATDAATAASLFWFAMEDPKAVTTQQIIYADAAAIRAVAASYRDAASNAAAVVDKQAALSKLQNDPLTAAVTSTDAKTGAVTVTTAAETQAERDVKTAAAQRDLDAAKATAAGNDAATFAAQQTAGQTSAKMIANIVAGTNTHAEAVKKVTAYLTTERAAFIAAQPAADQLSGKAAKAADAIGLIPAHAEIIIDADNNQLILKAQEAKAAADKVTTAKHEAQITATAVQHKKVLDEANARKLANKMAKIDGDPAPFNGVTAVIDGVVMPGKTVNIGGNTSQLEQDIAAAVDRATVAIQTWVPPVLTGPVGAGSSVYGASDYQFPSSVKKAGGGDIVGAGTGTSDSVPIWASTGEFVSTAATNARHHAQLMRWNAEGAYAGGGDIRARAATSTSGPLIGTVIQQPGQSSWQLAADLDRRMAFMGGR